MFCFKDGILLKREIIIYSISAGSIAILFALASCCFKYKREAEHLYKSRSQRTHHDQVSAEHENVQYNHNDESVYDLIDEENMVDDDTINNSEKSHEHIDQSENRHSATVEDYSSGSHSEEDVTDPSNEGYLNPYQPMIEVDLHGYQTLELEIRNQSEEISPGNLGSRISTAVQSCEHICPYQPIISLDYVAAHNSAQIDEAVQKLLSERSMSDCNTGIDDHCIEYAEQSSVPLTISQPIIIESEYDMNQTDEELVVVQSKLIDCNKNDNSSITGIGEKDSEMSAISA